ncbi:MAG: 23S rRNA (guanosine(2251)-2'-O)-methyltransferase RlmB [Gammaproteobacteria bacterium]
MSRRPAKSNAERYIYGVNPVQHIVANRPGQVVCIYLQEKLGKQRAARLTDALNSLSVETVRCSADRLEQLSGSPDHQGVVASIRPPLPLDEGEAEDFVLGLDKPLILVLDGVQDPRNFGSCLRTAEAAGVDLVVSSRNRSVDMTPTVSKVASGGAETQTIARVGNLVRFIKFLQQAGVRVVGTDGEATESLFAADLKGPLAVVLGGEGRGLRRLTRETCDALVSLPMHGAVESLNLAVAAGICLYECRRQRGQE